MHEVLTLQIPDSLARVKGLDLLLDDEISAITRNANRQPAQILGSKARNLGVCH